MKALILTLGVAAGLALSAGAAAAHPPAWYTPKPGFKPVPVYGGGFYKPYHPGHGWHGHTPHYPPSWGYKPAWGYAPGWSYIQPYPSRWHAPGWSFGYGFGR